jgi:hypothetical protein
MSPALDDKKHAGKAKRGKDTLDICEQNRADVKLKYTIIEEDVCVIPISTIQMRQSNIEFTCLRLRK